MPKMKGVVNKRQVKEVTEISNTKKNSAPCNEVPWPAFLENLEHYWQNYLNSRVFVWKFSLIWKVLGGWREKKKRIANCQPQSLFIRRWHTQHCLWVYCWAMERQTLHAHLDEDSSSGTDSPCRSGDTGLNQLSKETLRQNVMPYW